MSKGNYRGVYEASGKFNARIFVNKKQIHLGRFELAEDAARAYDNASLVLERPDANFPDEFVSLGRQQRALKVLIGKGAIEVPDTDIALEELVVEHTFMLGRLLDVNTTD